MLRRFSKLSQNAGGRVILCVMLLLLLFEPAIAAETSSRVYTLFDCAEIGIDRSFRLKSYDSKMRQDDAKVKETLSKNNPEVFINGSTTYQQPEIVFALALPGVPPLSSVITPQWFHDYNLNVSKLISSFGKVEANAKLQEMSVEQDRVQKDIDRDLLLFNIAQAYYAVILDEHLLSIAQVQAQEWEEQYKVSDAQFRRGVVAKYDLLRVEVALIQSKDAIRTAETHLEVSRGNLRTYMGLPRSEPVTEVREESTWGSEENHRLEFPVEKWLKIATENNSSLALCRVAQLQGKYAFELAMLDNAPSLVFNASYDRLTATFIQKDWAWKGTIALSLPLADGGERKYKMIQASEMIKQADLAYSDTEKNVLWNVEQAYLQLQDLYPKIETSRKQVEVSTEGLRVAKVRYKEGLSTLIEVLDAETSLRNSQVILHRNICSYYTQMAALSYASGTLQDDIFILGRPLK